jgi:serine protease Do
VLRRVETGGPPHDAGLKPGDVILAVDGRDIERSSELPPVVAAVKPGKEATLTIWRDKSERRLRVKVGELEYEPAVAQRGTPNDPATGKLGLAVRPLSGEERERLETAGRLVVEEVDGPAAIAGVQPGDVIIAVNGARVGSMGEFRTAVSAAGKSVALLIQRDDAQIFIPVRVDS